MFVVGGHCADFCRKSSKSRPPTGSEVYPGSNVCAASNGAVVQGQCTPATSAVAADHLVHLLKDRAAVVAAEAPGK